MARETKLTRELIAGDELHIRTPSGEEITIVCEQRAQDSGPSRSRYTVRAPDNVSILQVIGAR